MICKISEKERGYNLVVPFRVSIIHPDSSNCNPSDPFFLVNSLYCCPWHIANIYFLKLGTINIHQSSVPPSLTRSSLRQVCSCSECEIKSHRNQMKIELWFPAKLMPLYLFLTIFRALSISLVIVTLPVPFIWVPVYTFLLLVIICIGYHWTSQEKDFITRGLKSAFTSGLFTS